MSSALLNKYAGNHWLGGLDQNMLHQMLDDTGDGTGTFSANGDYSTTQKIFYIEAPAQTHYYISLFTVHLTDSGGLDAGKYGNGIVLTNGIKFRVTDTSGTNILIDLLARYTIVDNAGWNHICNTVTLSEFGTGDNSLSGKWDILQDMGFYLHLDPGQRLEVVLNDDYSGLNDHHFVAQGVAVAG